MMSMELFFPGGLLAAAQMYALCTAAFPGRDLRSLNIYSKCVNEYRSCVEAKVLPAMGCVDELEKSLRDRSFHIRYCEDQLN